MPRRFDRYKLTKGYNEIINVRQFQNKFRFPVNMIYPDTLYDEHYTLNVSGTTFECYHDKGMTLNCHC